MTKGPIISVIIPTYNRRQLLGEALRSVREQAGSWRLDVIVIDDGSTDDSEQVVRQFWGVRYAWQPNAGAAAARNHGVRIARGRWIAFLDSDDLWVRDKLQRQMSYIRHSGEAAAACYGAVQEFTDRVALAPERRPRIDATPLANRRLGSLLIRRRSFLRIGWFDEQKRINGTLDWTLRARAEGLREITLPEVLLHRRLHPGNVPPRFLAGRHHRAFRQSGAA